MTELTDNSGSYMRMTPDHQFPTTRPHNKHLSKIIIPTKELEGNLAERGIDARPANTSADIQRYSYKRTIYDREPNDSIEGGRLGRGRAKVRDFFKGMGQGIEKGVKIAAPLLPLVL